MLLALFFSGIWVLLSTQCQVIHCAVWASTTDLPDGTIQYACEGKPLTLPWKFSSSAGENVEDIKWTFAASKASDEIIAISAHGAFLPLPSFANRVHMDGATNAGLAFDHVTVGDSGNFSAEVTVLNADGTYQHLRTTVRVDVRDKLLTNDGRIHVLRNPDPVLLPGSSTDFAIELQCGNFSYSGDPPFQVEWDVPQGQTISNSTYTDNHFSLLLSDPIKGGNYTCRIPVRYYDDACLQGGDSSAAQDRLLVEEVSARIQILEAQNAALKAQLSAGNTSDANASGSGSHVAFHAEMVPQVSSDTGKRLLYNKQVFLFNDISLNQGGGYDNRNGVFTAPDTGTYHFSAIVTAWQTTSGTAGFSSDGVGFCLHVDGFSPDGRARCVWSPLPTAILTMESHVDQGQRVWVEANPKQGVQGYYNARLCHFEGFLIQ